MPFILSTLTKTRMFWDVGIPTLCGNSEINIGALEHRTQPCSTHFKGQYYIYCHIFLGTFVCFVCLLCELL